MQPYSIYIHIPFCQRRCSYCDFNTYAGQSDLIPAYVQALCTEIRLVAAHASTKSSVHSIFFGGGTPSILTVDQIGHILQELHSAFIIEHQAEVTLEANPGTVSLGYFQGIRSLGVNRLSLGMQSALPEELRLLERIHDFPDVIQAVHWARKAGLDNINLDLIFGLPQQSLQAWRGNLEWALRLSPEHLSLYSLILEHGTPLAQWTDRGLIAEPDVDLAADMYEWAMERLETAGFVQYEISNWARLKSHGEIAACRHNLQYWRNLPYLGFGAGAHGSADGKRTENLLSPSEYICSLQPYTVGNGQASWHKENFPASPAAQTVQLIDRQAEIGETMMMGLRLTAEGVSNRVFERRFHQPLEQVFSTEIKDLIEKGLLEWTGETTDSLRLTRRGRLLGNQVFMRFI